MLNPDAADALAATVLQARQQRAQAVLAEAQVRGWEPDPGDPSRWWLPGTAWRLKCNPQRCSIYLRTERAGAEQLKWHAVTQLTAITAMLDRINGTG